MIEITISIAFLMASMYGGSGIINNTNAINLNNSNKTGNPSEIVIDIDEKAVEKYIRENFSDTPILIEIARCESTFRHFDKNGDIIRGKVNNYDVGVMQINEKYHLETAEKLGFDIHTIEGNIDYAKYLYKKSGAIPWNASSPCWKGNVVAVK